MEVASNIAKVGGRVLELSVLMSRLDESGGELER